MTGLTTPITLLASLSQPQEFCSGEEISLALKQLPSQARECGALCTSEQWEWGKTAGVQKQQSQIKSILDIYSLLLKKQRTRFCCDFLYRQF